LVWLFITFDLRRTWELVSSANIFFLGLALIIAFADRVVMAYKWNILLIAKGISLPLPSVTASYLTSSFLGLFLPATVGADGLRAYAVAKMGEKMSYVVSSILLERVIGLVALLVFILIGTALSVFVMGYGFATDFWLAAIIALLTAGLLSAIALLMVDAAYVGRLLPSRVGRSSNRIVRLIWDVYESYSSFSNKPFHIVAFFFLSLFENLFPIFWTYLLVLAFGINVGLISIFILVPIILILVRIPISFDGFGVQELGFVYLLSFAGVAATQAFVLGASSHVIAIISVLPGAAIYASMGFRGGKKDGSEEVEDENRLT
jgi:hypothetical protein